MNPHIANTVQLDDDDQVFLTHLGDCKGLYVTNKTETNFEVHDIGNGTSNVGFEYPIVAHRAGYKYLRMGLDADFADRREVDLP